MTYETFQISCMQTMHHLHVAQIASMFHMTIDELMHNAYDNEFDDFAIIDHNDFNRMIDHIYTHFINWTRTRRTQRRVFYFLFISHAMQSHTIPHCLPTTPLNPHPYFPPIDIEWFPVEPFSQTAVRPQELGSKRQFTSLMISKFSSRILSFAFQSWAVNPIGSKRLPTKGQLT